MNRAALDRMALGERAVLAGVEVERVSLFGWRVGDEVADLENAIRIWEVLTVMGAVAGATIRIQERLRAGEPDTAARIAELRRQHGRALRVTGQARAKRARWTKAEAWLVVSYPKEARGT